MKPQSLLARRITPLVVGLTCLLILAGARLLMSHSLSSTLAFIFANGGQVSPLPHTGTAETPASIRQLFSLPLPIDLSRESWLGRLDFGLSPIFSRAASENLTVEKVFAPRVFEFQVIQQPENEDGYVSPVPEIVTQYRLPTQEGVAALIAHNYLAGRKFYELKPGAQIWLFFDDHSARSYRITQISKFRKVSPALLTSDLVDLVDQTTLTSNQAYDRFYTGAQHLTLQTCLEGNGRLDYGLMFVVAEPEN